MTNLQNSVRPLEEERFCFPFSSAIIFVIVGGGSWVALKGGEQAIVATYTWFSAFGCALGYTRLSSGEPLVDNLRALIL